MAWASLSSFESGANLLAGSNNGSMAPSWAVCITNHNQELEIFLYRCTMCWKNPIGLLRHISQVIVSFMVSFFWKMESKTSKETTWKMTQKPHFSKTAVVSVFDAFLFFIHFSSIFRVRVSSCRRVFRCCLFFFFFPDIAIASFYSPISLLNEQKREIRHFW